jgi:tRNA(Ile)-lysidine synthase
LLTSEALRGPIVRLIGAEASESNSFGIAVSGGPDSMALLAVAAEAFPGRISAATVDHGLRAESANEAAMVAGICASLTVPHTILRPATPITGSVQAAARAVRYALLEQWRVAAGVDWLMTAHHADDQLETLVMRLNRSSGLAGLAGIRARQGNIVRPLLAVRREVLVETVRARGLPSVEDPSNIDDRFDRARVRKALASSDLLDAAAVSSSARHLSEAEEALDWTVTRLAGERLVIADGVAALDASALPRDIQRRLLLVALAAMGEEPPRGRTLDAALEALEAGDNAMIGDHILAPGNARWTIRAAPPRSPH